MPILNSIGALSIEEGGDNNSGNLPVQKSFLKVVPSHTGNTFIIKQVRSFEIYEYSTDSGSYSLAYTIDTPTDFPTQSGVGQNILADDCDISYGGDRVLVSFYDSNQYNSKVYAYQLVGGVWTLKNSVLDAGVNRNFRFGYSVSVSWADNGCVISSYYGSNAVTGFVYYYGDIWSSTSGTVRSTLPRVSTEVNGAVKEYPFSAQITKDGSYARAATQISGVYANTDVWSITTKSGATLPLNAKWHEFSDKLNLLNREFSAKVLSGDKKVSFEMDAAMTYIKVTRDLVVVPVAPPTISVPVKTFSFETGVAVNQVVATSTGVGVPVYAISPALPTGLVFNTATATITGTPTSVTGVTLYTVTVGYNGDTASDGFSLKTLMPRTVTLNGIGGFSFNIGKSIMPFSIATISGFSQPVTYTITPALPSGVTFNTSTGVMSGTPSAIKAVSTYQLTVSDADSSRSINFDIEVTSAFTVSPIVTTLQLEISKSFTSSLATTANNFASVTYSITPSLPSGLILNSTTGTITGTPTTLLPSTTYTVTVSDSIVIKTFTFTLSTFSTMTVTSLGNKTFALGSTVNSSIVNVVGSSSTFTYSITPSLPSGLILNSTTGTITGSPNSVIQSLTPYTVSVADTYGLVKSVTVQISISSDFSLSVLVSNYSFGIGSFYSFKPVNALGSSGPYTYSINPSLPDGISIDSSSGVISGTSVSLVSATNYTITVVDKFNKTLSANSIVISTFSQLKLISYTTNSRSYYMGSTVTDDLLAYPTGSSEPYTYSISPALPEGLTFNTASGAISGSPTRTSSSYVTLPNQNVAGGYYTLTVKDKYNLTATSVFQIYSISPWKVYDAEINFSINSTVSYQISTGVTVPYAITYRLSSGTLPSGLSLNSSTGLISGTTTSQTGTKIIYVQVYDIFKISKTIQLNINVYSDIRTSNLSLGRYSLAQNINAQIPSSGTATPFVFSISPTLPAGMSLNTNTGAITGGATVPVTYSGTATIRDATGATTTSLVTFNYKTGFRVISPNNPIPYVTTDTGNLNILAGSTFNTATTGVVSSVQALPLLFTSGGSSNGYEYVPPYSVTIIPSLPSWINVVDYPQTSTKTLLYSPPALQDWSGTAPSTLSSTPYTLSITDSYGSTQSSSFNIKVVSDTQMMNMPSLVSYNTSLSSLEFALIYSSASSLTITSSIALPGDLTISAVRTISTTTNGKFAQGTSCFALVLSGTVSSTESAILRTLTITDSFGGSITTPFYLQIT